MHYPRTSVGLNASVGRLVRCSRSANLASRTLRAASSILDGSRRARANLLLENKRLSCSEVAFLLGYVEPAAFFRDFKRWTGLSPQGWRQRIAAAL